MSIINMIWQAHFPHPSLHTFCALSCPIVPGSLHFPQREQRHKRGLSVTTLGVSSGDCLACFTSRARVMACLSQVCQSLEPAELRSPAPTYKLDAAPLFYRLKPAANIRGLTATAPPHRQQQSSPTNASLHTKWQSTFQALMVLSFTLTLQTFC